MEVMETAIMETEGTVMEETKVAAVCANPATTNTRARSIFLIRVKGILSTIIIVLFVPVAFSGIGLYFAPSGRQARISNWSFLGFSRFQLETLHDIPGLILVIAFVIHLLLNLRIYSNEIKCLFLRKK